MNKQNTIRTVAAKTRLSYIDVQRVLEGIVEVWSAELASGGYVVIQDFLTLKAQFQVLPAKPLRGQKPNGRRKKKVYYVETKTSDALVKRMSKGNWSTETSVEEAKTSSGKKKIEWK